MVSPVKKKKIWVIWLVVFPIGLWLAYQIYPPEISGEGINLFVFLLLISVVAAIPMVINGTPIFLVQWVSWAVFLIFGIFVELVMAQLALIVLFISVKLPREQFFRLPLNSIMFFVVSVLSGGLYYMIGGKTGDSLSSDNLTFWLIVIYPALYYLFNHLILIIFNVVVYNNKKQYFGLDFVWETVTTLITFPFGFVLYILYQEVSLMAVLFVSIPFASLSIILNLYYSSSKINENLQKATEIGHQLAERLNVDEVIDLFTKRVSEMLTVDYAYILDIVEDKELQLIRRIEKGKEKSNDIQPLNKNEGISGSVWEERKAALYKSKNEWKHIAKGYMPDNVESILSVPIIRNNQVTAILTLGSIKKRAYAKSQLMIVDILCSYFAIAVENARHYKETKEKSEQCALTKLFNYRYFEKLLNDQFEKLKKQEIEQLSLIILDIDHFKAVNDTYGHQSGNEILCELASELTRLIDGLGTIARYGGEEFVILLPNVKKEEALNIAELVRHKIANHSYTLTQHLDIDDFPLYVNITASIGVATSPQDADDPLALVRHADRALYVGAKKAGRNRVAEYVK